MSRHSSANTIIFVNDPYDIVESIKSGEHARRKIQQYVHGSKDVFIRSSKTFPNQKNLNNVFINKEDTQKLLADLGKSLVLREEVYRIVNMFVICYVYNNKKSNNLADSRSLIWKIMKKTTTQRLPPDEDSLK